MRALIPVGLQLCALACLAVAYVNRDDGEVEGAYFNRAAGEDASVLAFDSDVRPWLIAAAVLLVLSVALSLARAVRDRR